MSMIGYFHLVDALTWRRLVAGPSTIGRILGKTWRRLVPAPSTIELLIEQAYEAPRDRTVDVDKAWHALHFLLTGTAWEGAPPLDFIVRGGTELGDDLGYGPPRGFAPAEVAAIADALTPLTVDDLVRRFDATKMRALEIYPAGDWSDIDPRDPDSFGYFSGAFEDVKRLVLRGRDEGAALLVWLS